MFGRTFFRKENKLERSIWKYDRSDHKRKLKLVANGPCIDCLMWSMCQNKNYNMLLRSCLPLCEYWALERKGHFISDAAKNLYQLHLSNQ